MTDLIEALKTNDINNIDVLLQQLGKTPFFNKTSPTPVDEAVSLVWFLENIFYHAVSGIQANWKKNLILTIPMHQILELGFWPGGDRDGNPNVTTETTKDGCQLLKADHFPLLLPRFQGVETPYHFQGC